MKSKTIIFRDPVVERVCDKFVKRSDVGYAKYGRTLHDERTGRHKNLAGYLNDVQEELMDAILYIQAAKEEISDIFKDAKPKFFLYEKKFLKVKNYIIENNLITKIKTLCIDTKNYYKLILLLLNCLM